MRKRYRSSDRGDFDQQYSSGVVSEAFGSSESFEQAFPDVDRAPIFSDAQNRSGMDFQGFQGHEADFGHATLKLPQRRALGSARANPFSYNPKLMLPQAQIKPMQGISEVSNIFNSIKWIAFAGLAVFAYYKLKENKAELSGMVKSARDAAKAAQNSFLKSNPVAKVKVEVDADESDEADEDEDESEND